MRLQRGGIFRGEISVGWYQKNFLIQAEYHDGSRVDKHKKYIYDPRRPAER